MVMDLKHHIDLNAPLHSNWARLLKTTNQSVVSKQHVNLLEQSTTLEFFWKRYK
jgi:hypothetical protein